MRAFRKLPIATNEVIPVGCGQQRNDQGGCCFIGSVLKPLYTLQSFSDTLNLWVFSLGSCGSPLPSPFYVSSLRVSSCCPWRRYRALTCEEEVQKHRRCVHRPGLPSSLRCRFPNSFYPRCCLIMSMNNLIQISKEIT